MRDRCIEALQARRNHHGGYWIAKDDPHAAEEAVAGSCPLQDLDSAALLSNGASRIVSPYGLTSWPGLLELLGAGGPAEIIRRVRQAEAAISQNPEARVPDDATVTHCNRLQVAIQQASASYCCLPLSRGGTLEPPWILRRARRSVTGIC